MRSLSALLSCIVVVCMPETISAQARPIHLLPAPSPDPWMVRDSSEYLFIASRGNAIVLRRSRDWKTIVEDSGRIVWRAPRSGPYSHEIWAPELHRWGERWTIYFAGDDGDNVHHRMWVITSVGGKAEGPYGVPRRVTTPRWAIDGTILTMPDSAHYFVWSGWPGEKDGQQNLYVARMKSPAVLDTPSVLIAEPTEVWERRTLPLCEGPAVLQRNGRTFIVYSASASWTRDYCLGMLVLEGIDPLKRMMWRKVGPVLMEWGDFYGPGHCSFTQDERGNDLILFHAKGRKEPGWEDRSAWGMEVKWDANGMPVFQPE